MECSSSSWVFLWICVDKVGYFLLLEWNLVLLMNLIASMLGRILLGHFHFVACDDDPSSWWSSNSTSCGAFNSWDASFDSRPPSSFSGLVSIVDLSWTIVLKFSLCTHSIVGFWKLGVNVSSNLRSCVIIIFFVETSIGLIVGIVSYKNTP